MIDLSTATVEQIKAELARRERLSKISDPVPLPDPNFDYLTEMAESYINCIRDGDDVTDIKVHIFESAITAVYGLRVWDWVNTKRR